ncbi:response regulator receiver protein [Solidesulfovibrio carbinoliphilus subsp. oakridgensis]|uniref:Response regulator receiver protein n=1 Tax=Solidesulfovibrio carbinoliphilus subsp. oakridgensis TaxID=694327 RepID=G7QBE5_9BACT|nr:response regulator [Solidesulfovibrio carbinoliphilus]EHJ49368.1 response regulator receiver protein [Solidesulfovibrio carbinoliphilus subsp. oakridgensis]
MNRPSALMDGDPPTAAAPPPSRRRRLLLAEDSESNRALIGLFLKNEPYDIAMAGTGREAVALFAAGPFDLVLMDMEMPEMDGYAATEAIRRLEAATGAAPTPVLMLSAHTFREYEARGRRAGCDGFLAKPINKATLVRILADLLAARPPAGPGRG